MAENQKGQFFQKLREQSNVFSFGSFPSGFVYVFVRVILAKESVQRRILAKSVQRRILAKESVQRRILAKSVQRRILLNSCSRLFHNSRINAPSLIVNLTNQVGRRLLRFIFFTTIKEVLGILIKIRALRCDDHSHLM